MHRGILWKIASETFKQNPTKYLKKIIFKTVACSKY